MPKNHQAIVKILKKYQHIIWDWNGTLLDDLEMVVEVNNLLLKEQGLATITVEDHRQRFTHPVVDYYRGLGLNVEGEQFKVLGQRFIELYVERMNQVSLFSGIAQMLEALNLAGHQQSMLSASHQPQLRQFVVERPKSSPWPG